MQKPRWLIEAGEVYFDQSAFLGVAVLIDYSGFPLPQDVGPADNANCGAPLLDILPGQRRFGVQLIGRGDLLLRHSDAVPRVKRITVGPCQRSAGLAVQ